MHDNILYKYFLKIISTTTNYYDKVNSLNHLERSITCRCKIDMIKKDLKFDKVPLL